MNVPQRMTIAKFGPDQPETSAGVSRTIENVLPKTSLSYSPLPNFAPFSSAMSNRFQGGLAFSTTSGDARVFTGDVSKLYRYAGAGDTPIDVSKTGGYTTPASYRWGMALFGERVIATNGTDAIQSYVEGTSSVFADMITTGITSLRSKVVDVVSDWVVLGDTTDSTYGDKDQRVWWLAVNDPTDAPIPGTEDAANKLSDFQDIPGDHGKLIGIAGNLGFSNAGLFFERAVFRMNYSGLPKIFEITPAEGARGLLARGALCKFGPKAYYAGEDGFYVFDGNSSTPIGKEWVDEFVYNDMDSAYLDRITCTQDPARGLIFWAYPSSGSADGIVNRLLCYSPAFNKWAISDVTSLSLEGLLNAPTFGKTLEQLDTFGTIDSLQFSLDSTVWQGVRRSLAAVDSDHKLGYFSGEALPAKIDTENISLGPRRTILTRVRPLIDNSSAKVAVCSRVRLSDSNTYTDLQAQEDDGSVAVDSEGRYHKVRVETTLGEEWSEMSGVDVEEYADSGV